MNPNKKSTNINEINAGQNTYTPVSRIHPGTPLKEGIMKQWEPFYFGLTKNYPTRFADNRFLVFL